MRAAQAIDAGDDSARELSTAAKVTASDTAVWAVDRAARLAASRSYAAGDELARLRRDAPQTQIGEGANDALLLALARPLLRGYPAQLREARQPVVGQRLPVGRRGHELVPLGADAGVAVERAEAHDDQPAARRPAEDVPAALAAEALGQAGRRLPGADGLLALRDREVLAADEAVERPERAAAALAALAVAVAGGVERGGDGEADGAAGAGAGHGLVW